MTFRPSQEYSLLDRGIRKLWFCNKNKDDAYQEYNASIVHCDYPSSGQVPRNF